MIERPTDLEFWLQNGCATNYRSRVKADTEVSIGRTNSKRGLGFIVITNGKVVTDFTLDKDQVAELAAFLQLALPRLLKPLGRKRKQLLSVVEMVQRRVR